MQYFFKKLNLKICLWVLLVGTIPANSLAKVEKQAFERGLILLGGPSLTNVMHEILKDFSLKRNISIASTFSATEELATSIEEGEPANIFISEDPIRMRDLQRKGVLNVYSLTDLATDKLVIVMPKKHYLLKKLGNFENFTKKLKFVMQNSIMAVTDPESDPSGYYTKQALEVMGLWETAKLRTIKTDNTRRSMYLSRYSNNPSIVYYSDAAKNPNVKIIGEIPQKYYDKIIYQAAIVAEISSGSDLKDSEEFVKYLKSEKVIQQFKDKGFGGV